jgi:hypothetical protein
VQVCGYPSAIVQEVVLPLGEQAVPFRLWQ